MVAAESADDADVSATAEEAVERDVLAATTALPDDVLALAAPIEPVCQTAPKAMTKVAARLAAARRRIVEIRRARAARRARAMFWEVSV